MNLMNRVKTLVTQTKLEIYDKNQIHTIFPFLNGYVDLMLVSNDYFICFKDFWTFDNLNIKVLNTYFTGSDNLKKNNINKNFIFILFTKNNFSNKNNILNNILLEKNIFILEKNNTSDLLNELSYFLYSLNIYFYDNDLDTIMLN